MNKTLEQTLPDERGYFGAYGGRFVPETLIPALEKTAAQAQRAGDFGTRQRLNREFHVLLARATRFGPLKDFSYDDDAEVIDGVHAQRFGAVWTLDLEAQYKFSKQLTLALGADNILDRYPQRVRETNNATYGGALPYNFINPIGVNGAYFYARARYTF